MEKTLQGYNLTEEFEKQLWTECIFVFDSSALLNFYEYSKETRSEINKNIFKNLKGRLWITKHTEYEYLKNRESVLVKPAKLYDELITLHFDLKQFQNFKNQFSSLKERTKKTNKHPFIKPSIVNGFESKLFSFESELILFHQELKVEIEKKKQEILKIQVKDTVLNSFARFFSVGNDYSFDKCMEIVEQGEIRYRNSIPPGYEDLREKQGLQIYGDLIIWNQIIDIAKVKKKPVILIIDDLKIDWCYKNHKDKNIIDSPREELIKEMKDKCDVDFWSYSSTQFLDKSNHLLGTVIAESVIEEVKVSNQFAITQRVEQEVLLWAKRYFQGVGEVITMTDYDLGADFLLKRNDNINVGIEIKYYPKYRKQSVQNLVEHLLPRFTSRGYLDKFDELMLIIACETRELAEEINTSRIKYEETSNRYIQIIVGYMDHGIFNNNI